MKRYNNLFEKIVSIDNLYLADKKARKNKSNRNDIKEFDKYKDSLLVRLQIGWMKHCNGINLLKKIIKYHQLIEYARSS